MDVPRFRHASDISLVEVRYGKTQIIVVPNQIPMFNSESLESVRGKIGVNHRVSGFFQEWLEVDDAFSPIAKTQRYLVTGQVLRIDKIDYCSFGESPLIRRVIFFGSMGL